MSELRVRHVVTAALLTTATLLWLFQQNMRPKISLITGSTRNRLDDDHLRILGMQADDHSTTCMTMPSPPSENIGKSNPEALVFAQRSRIRLNVENLLEQRHRGMISNNRNLAVFSLGASSPLMEVLRQRRRDPVKSKTPEGGGSSTTLDGGVPLHQVQVEVVLGSDEDFSWMIPPWHADAHNIHKVKKEAGGPVESSSDDEEGREPLFCPTTVYEQRYFFEPPEFALARTIFVAVPFGSCGGLVQLHELSASAHIHETIGRSIRILHNGGSSMEELTVFCVYECLRDPYCRYMIIEMSSAAASFCHHFSTFYDELAERDHPTQRRLLSMARRFRVLQFAYRRAVPASLLRPGPTLRVLNGPLDVVRVGDDGLCWDCLWRIDVENIDKNVLDSVALPVTVVVEDLGRPEKLDVETLSSSDSMKKNGTLLFVTGGSMVRGTFTFHFAFFGLENFGPVWGHQWRISVVVDGTRLGVAKSTLKTRMNLVVQGHPHQPPAAVLLATGESSKATKVVIQHDPKVCGTHIGENECCITNVALRMRGGRQMPPNALYDSSQNFDARPVSVSLRSTGNMPENCTLTIVDGEAAIAFSAAADFDRLVIRNSCARREAGQLLVSEGAKIVFAAKTDFGSPELEVPADQLLQWCGRPNSSAAADGTSTVLISDHTPAASSLARILVSTYARPRCPACVVQHIENILAFLPHSTVVLLLGREFSADDRRWILASLEELKLAACGGKSCENKVNLHFQPASLDRLFEPWLVSLIHGLNLDYYDTLKSNHQDHQSNPIDDAYSHVVFWNNEHLFVRAGIEQYVARYSLSSFRMAPTSRNPFAQSQPQQYIHVCRPEALVDESLAVISSSYLPVGRGPTEKGIRDEFHLAAVMRKYNATKFVREPTAMAGTFLSRSLATKFKKILLEDFFFSVVELLNSSSSGGNRNAASRSKTKAHLKFFEYYNVGEVVLATFFQPMCSQSGGALVCGDRISSTANARRDEFAEERDVKRVRCSVGELPFGLARFREGSDHDAVRLFVQSIHRDVRRLPLARDDDRICG